MKRNILVFFVILMISNCVFSQVNRSKKAEDYYQADYLRNSDFVYKPNIKTVLFHRLGFELSSPIMQLNNGEQLLLSFDDLDAEYQKYEYTIIHCDANWNNSDLMQNEYLESYADDYIKSYQFSMNTMQSYVYYELAIPNEVVNFTLSGNYVIKVYTEGNPDDIVLTRRFFVFEPMVSMVANARVPASVDDRYSKHEIVFTILPLGYAINDPNRELKVTVQQNGRWDNAITDLKPKNIMGNELRYDYDGINVFDCGSDFRYFDMKSLRYNSFRVKSLEYSLETGYQVNLHPDAVKLKHVAVNTQESINGRFLIKTEDMQSSSTESDYATVNFFLAYPNPLIEGKLYVFGELTQWQFLQEAELTYNYELKGFTGQMLLKQGYYNYQYVMLPNNSKVGDVTLVEGNFFETNNQYTIYVYHRPMGTRYDKLINITTLLAHPN
jgi:hypothetical protein